MLFNVILFVVSLFLVIKSAEYCTMFSSKLAKFFHLSEFIVSFFVVAVISVFPEATISIVSAVKGIPELGLGTLLGSNVADLTLVFVIVALISANGIHVKSEILKKNFFYLFLLLFPVLLGLDGYLSRVDGILLVASGIVFFFTLSLESRMFRKKWNNLTDFYFLKNVFLLIAFLAVLIISAHYTVQFGINVANDLQIPAIIIGLTIISIGTCLPELTFSIKAIQNKHDELVLGDILGTVITDATIILGIVSIINPFHFKPLLIYVTGLAMFIAGILTISFITSHKVLSKKEGIFLLLFYGGYLIVELIINEVL